MKGAATSSSPTTGRPAARAAMSQGSSGGTPGDRTMASKPCQRGWATPRSSTTPRPWMSRRKLGQVIRRRLIGDRHPGAVLDQKTAQGHPGPGQADD